MNDHNSTQTIGVALNFATGSDADNVPDWIQLTPAGPDVKGRDGRQFKLTDPDAVVAAFENNGADLPVDIEHATQIHGGNGNPAPAIGWIKKLEVRNNAIWGRVEWLEKGRDAIASKAYRYVSPVFTLKKTAGEIVKMLSAGLTNQPNLYLAALNQAGQEKERTMDKEIPKALGLSDTATEADVLTAINTLKADEQTARNRADTPDAAKFVPRGDYDLAMNKIADFEKAAAKRLNDAITDAVDGAIEAGKIAPASRDYHIAACRSDGGLDKFNDMVAASAVIADKADLPGGGQAVTGTTLTDEERAVCRALGMKEKDFAAAKAENTKQEASV